MNLPKLYLTNCLYFSIIYSFKRYNLFIYIVTTGLRPLTVTRWIINVYNNNFVDVKNAITYWDLNPLLLDEKLSRQHFTMEISNNNELSFCTEGETILARSHIWYHIFFSPISIPTDTLNKLVIIIWLRCWLNSFLCTLQKSQKNYIILYTQLL